MGHWRAGTTGWVVVAGTITVTDWWLIRHERETLSMVFGEALKNPIKKWPTMAVWAVLTLHLFAELLPGQIRIVVGKYDPIGRLARWMERKPVDRSLTL